MYVWSSQIGSQLVLSSNSKKPFPWNIGKPFLLILIGRALHIVHNVMRGFFAVLKKMLVSDRLS